MRTSYKMEGFPLNFAHQKERKAEHLVAQGKLVDAVSCYRQAAEYLTKSMQQTDDPIALQSLRLQHDNYLHQGQLLNNKAAMQNDGHSQDTSSKDSGPYSIPEVLHALTSLQENDTLLAFLERRCSEDSEQLDDGKSGKSQDEIVRSAIKTPKTDPTVIEELKTNNEALKKFIDELAKQLEKSEQEKSNLRMQLEDVESSNRTLSLMVKEMGAHIKRLEKTTLKSLCNSNGSSLGSSDSKARAEIAESANSLVDVGLPQLAPLEMPQFDFNVIDSHSNKRMYRYVKPVKEQHPLLPKVPVNADRGLEPASVRAANEEVIAAGLPNVSGDGADHGTVGNVGKKRRVMYNAYSPELRAKIGRYAARNGTAAACRKFSLEIGAPVNESTVRGMRSAYLTKIEENSQQEVDRLPLHERGRPPLLGKYDDDVKAYIRGIRQAGGAVSPKVVLAGTKGLLKNTKPPILAEYGGNIHLDKTWARSFLDRMGYSKRKGTKGVKTRPEDFELVGGRFWRRIGHRVRKYDIPDELILNWDQTGVNVVPGGQWTMELKGEWQVPLQGIDDKRQYTVLLACSLAGDFLPPQVIYPGKTQQCHPAVEFPPEWDVWHTESHRSTTDSMIRYIDNVIEPYVKSTQERLQTTSPPLLICDVSRAHTCEEVRARIAEMGALLVYVPAACTDLLQPLDATVNNRYKQELNAQFNEWYAEKVAQGIWEGREIADIAKGIDLRTAAIKPIHANWLMRVHDVLRRDREIVIKGWESTKILDAVRESRNAPVPDLDDSDAEGV
ncbi:PREDICTED: uncharacterized protein LOC106806484 [Priapulus caudatus]|uniref:Uncharacterized protein LOC106806484 n=1 Tax=Priapulus caudatus TaxID=37621 RepID=A0ABM1DVF9_PRICU|nr:PREDICTED: uncharacterized protein LOC106806484 [Priapulus caudatus]